MENTKRILSRPFENVWRINKDQAVYNWKNMKRANKIVGVVGICINVLILFYSLHWCYLYNFTSGRLFLFMYPNWVLVVNSFLSIIGIFISILLMRNKIGMKWFLIITILLWLVVLSNFFFPIY